MNRAVQGKQGRRESEIEDENTKITELVYRNELNKRIWKTDYRERQREGR